MKKHLLTITFGVISTLSVFTSCKKEKDIVEPNPTGNSCYIESFIPDDTTKYVFTYNDLKQVIKTEAYINGKSDSYDTYSYSSDKISIVSYLNKGARVETECFLNAKGYIGHLYRTGYFDWATTHDTTYYFYDNEGYNILELTDKRDSTVYTYSQGNLISSRYFSYGKENSSTTYTYTSNENKFDLMSLIMHGLLIQGIFGKESLNLVAKTVETDSDKSIITSNYSYDLNSYGYIDRLKANIEFSDKPKENYSINCKVNYNCK